MATCSHCSYDGVWSRRSGLSRLLLGKVFWYPLGMDTVSSKVVHANIVATDMHALIDDVNYVVIHTSVPF